MSAKEEYTQIIKDVYSINSFVKLCDMELVDVECGKVTLAMPIDAAKHTNLYEVAHGGSLAALADTALGMASASVGARVVTINYTINFIKNLHAGDVATAVGTVIQRGHKIIIIILMTIMLMIILIKIIIMAVMTILHKIKMDIILDTIIMLILKQIITCQIILTS